MIFASRTYADKPFIDVPIYIYSLYMYTCKSTGFLFHLVCINILSNDSPYLVVVVFFFWWDFPLGDHRFSAPVSRVAVRLQDMTTGELSGKLEGRF